MALGRGGERVIVCGMMTAGSVEKDVIHMLHSTTATNHLETGHLRQCWSVKCRPSWAMWCLPWPWASGEARNVGPPRTRCSFVRRCQLLAREEAAACNNLESGIRSNSRLDPMDGHIYEVFFFFVFSCRP